MVQPPPRADVEQWLAEAAAPLLHVDAGAVADDLDLFDQVVGDARVVGIGEPTHGTSEYYRLFHRLVRRLVERHGFRLVIFESPFTESLSIDRYVTGGGGDARTVLTGQRYWVWDTEEVVALVEWLREYNRDRKENAARFLGCDIQWVSESLRALRRIAVERAPAVAAEFDQILRPLANPLTGTATAMQTMPAGEVERMAEALETLTRSLRLQPIERLHAGVIEQTIRMARRGGDPQVRDQAMAENVLQLLDAVGGDARAVFWAHRCHARRGSWPTWNGDPARATGDFLAATLGDAYVCFGSAFGTGASNNFAADPPHWPVAAEFRPPPAGSFDAVLLDASDDDVLVALEVAAPPTVASWLASRPLSRMVGALWHGEVWVEEQDPRELYDGLFFLRESSPAQPTPHASPALAVLPPVEPLGTPLDITASADAWASLVKPIAGHHVTVETTSGGAVLVIERRWEGWSWGTGIAARSLEVSEVMLHLRVSVRCDADGFGDAAFVALRIGERRVLSEPITAAGWVPVVLEASCTERAAATVELMLAGNGRAEFRDLELAAGAATGPVGGET